MTRKGTELATAYYSLVPSLDGTAAAVNSQMGVVTAAGSRAGVAGGAAMGAGLGRGLKIAGGIGVALGAFGLLSSAQDYFAGAVDLASDLAESGNAINGSFGDAAGGIAALGTTAASRLGLSNIAFNDLAVRFSSFAGIIAGEGGDVVGVIDDLTTRGADFASVYNLEVSDALALFQSGLAGETEPLRRYGIDLSAAAVEAFALANGIGEQGAALTEAEKVQARYLLLLQETDQTAGDFANTSDGLANQQRITNARFEDAQAAIGEALMPAALRFSDWMLDKGVPLVERLIDVFDKAEPFITGAADAFVGFLDMQFGALATVMDLIAAFDDGILTVEEMRDAYANLPEPIMDAIIAIDQFIYDTVRGIHNFVAGGLNTIIGFLNGYLDVVRVVADAMNEVFGTDIQVARLGYVPNIGAFSFQEFFRGSRAPDIQAGGRTMMASGAYVPSQRGGVAATIGEGRHDEVVLPLSEQVFRQLGDAIGGGSSTPIQVNGATVAHLLRMVDGRAEIVLDRAVTALGFDMRAGGVA